MQFHKYSEIFPVLPEDRLEELALDIQKNGLQEPIVTFEDKILDGRNRFRACEKVKIIAEFVEYQGDDPLGYVISLNLHRRHLSESQRAMVAANLANMNQGERTDLQPSENLPKVSQEKAAEMLNVSDRTLRTAKKVKETGSAELIEAVQSGKVSVSAAADIATEPQEVQQEIVAKGEREILQAAKQIRAKKAEISRAQRIEKIVEISKGNRDLSIEKKYSIIYADPPWAYENPPMGGSNRSIENHYPTMTLDEICALPVKDIAGEDSLLYLWATSPKLEECFRVIKSWGFEYRTSFVWVKDKIGMGYHARNQHELLLVCKRGNIPPPAIENRVSSVIEAPRTEHSKKPVEFYELIESMYPEMVRLEMFCRQPREGWEVWGNQV